MTAKQRLPWDPPRDNRNTTYKERPRSKPSAAIYHTWRWTRLSRAYRAQHPLCAECNRRGIIRAATCVDHITPWPICGEQGFFDRANLQALCNECNNTKGQRDKRIIQEWKKAHPEAAGEAGTGSRTPQPATPGRRLKLTRQKR